MIADFLVNVCAAVVSSIICGIFANKAFGKNRDILTIIYSIYISFSIFAFLILLAFVLSDSMKNVFALWTGQNAFTVLKYISSLFWILFVNVSAVTIIFIIARLIENSQKSIDKLNKYCNPQKKEDKDR